MMNADTNTIEGVVNLLEMPLNNLLLKAHLIYKENFNQNEVQVSTLLSIKTGGCPENCKYCPQSAHYKTDVKKDSIEIDEILSKAQIAKSSGATRFCMGAAWRSLHDKDLDKVCSIIKEVKKTGMEVCMTLGMITKKQADAMKESGLDFYNHNIDSSRTFYNAIITTRTYDERLETIKNVSDSGINLCSGGILGMGETLQDRAEMLLTLASFNPQPKSVPINMLVKAHGTPLEKQEDIDPIDFVRVVAAARILMPQSYIRLSAGRVKMSKEMQALCFFAGANSVFYGEKLLTTDNNDAEEDIKMFEDLGIEIAKSKVA